MKPTVFIHTNAKQILGAIVSEYSLKRNSKRPDDFDVVILKQEEFDFFKQKEGQAFARAGGTRIWRNDDLQSFTPLRFMPPEKMGYEGRAVIMDPDIFAVGDIMELLERDMEGKAIMAVPRFGHNNRKDYVATSVMLLDCAKLRHWHCETMFNELFEGNRDYGDLIDLADEDPETIGFLEPYWNHFDKLTSETRLLHNTKRKTQPWKTGLPVDFTVRNIFFGLLPGAWFTAKTYQPHPDPNQEAFFFGLVQECLDKGIVTEQLIKDEMAKNHVRHDAFEVLERLKTRQAAE